MTSILGQSSHISGRALTGLSAEIPLLKKLPKRARSGDERRIGALHEERHVICSFTFNAAQHRFFHQRGVQKWVWSI